MKTILISGLALIGVILFVNMQSRQSNDGRYSGRSQSVYTNEPYVGFVQFDVKNDQVTGLHFEIRDTLNNELFDENYESHYPDNEVYQQQCRDNWKGVLHYPSEVKTVSDTAKIDAISGATWSYNIFKASMDDALNHPQTP